MKGLKITSFSTFVIIFLTIAHADAVTITATSCSQVDVQAAINSANEGDTVYVPAGSCTWKTKVTISKGIILQGAGIDQTTIVDNVPTAVGQSGKEALLIAVNSGTAPRVTGFTFSDTGSYYNYLGTVLVTGSVNGFRIDHCKFLGCNSRGVSVTTPASGLIDNCQFINIAGQGVFIRPLSSQSDSIWATETHLGGGDAVYIEDCTFNYEKVEPALDGEYGAKMVFRHNTLINSWILCHGYESNRSTLRFEAYDNSFSQTTSLSSTATIVFRGGTGVIFNNVIKGIWLYPLMFRDYCACGNNDVCKHSECTSYPCPDQVGRSYNQKHEPLYQWNNKYNDNQVTGHVFDSCAEEDFSVNSTIQVNRDFFNAVKTGYTPYTYPHPLTEVKAPSPSTKPDPPVLTIGSGS